MRSSLLLLLCLTVAMPTTGCSRSAVAVHGQVTLNGASLTEGYITFFPVEGMQATCGTDIREGQYEIQKLAPGPWRVVIAPAPSARIVRSAQGTPAAVVTPTAKTEGNNRIVTISAADQTLDFHLRSQPAAR
jgi:hypothetical protein